VVVAREFAAALGERAVVPGHFDSRHPHRSRVPGWRS
jgi:hypothetical protein